MVKIMQTRAFKLTVKFLFSHVGLCLLVTSYVVGGGFLFRSLEMESDLLSATRANKSAVLVKNTTEMIVNQIKDFVDFCKAVQRNDNTTQWSDTYSEQNCTSGNSTLYTFVTNFHQLIVSKSQENDTYYQGQFEYPVELKSWTIASSILFTASILTTIGYGHIFPKTEIGRLTVILYSLLAIPLMSIFLVNYGTLFGDMLYFAYRKVCCCPMNRARAKTHCVGRTITVGAKTGQALVINDEKDDAKATDANGDRRSCDKSAECQRGDTEQTGHVPASLAIGVAALVCLAGTLIFSSTENWSLITSFYFTFITLSTIGFGDYVPGWRNGRETSALMMTVLAICVVFGLTIMAMVLKMAMFTLMDHAQKWSSAIKNQVNVLKHKSMKQI